MLSPPVSDADLHGLVDGHLDVSRRADVLRRLAKAPEDRMRVETWQDQTDMLRAAFGGIDREPLPAMLDLTSKPRLRCVSDEDAPMVVTPAMKPGPARRSVVGVLLVVAALAGCVWYLVPSGASDPSLADFRLRGPVDEALRARTVAALGEAPKPGIGLPTLTIPDLEMAGFSFVGAETQASQPASLLFRYRNAASEILVISVARGTVAPSQPPVHAGDVYLWRSRDNAFAMAGTIKPERLRAIATALQSDDIQ